MNYIPATVAGPTDISRISATNQTVLAMTSSGDVYAWGQNYSGQLGFRYPEVILEPVKLDLPGSVSWVAAGGSDYSLLVSGGTLYSAGDDSHLQLGMGRLVHSAEPLVVLPEVPLAGP